MLRLGLQPVTDSRDWLTLFNDSWWRAASFHGHRIPPRSWRMVAVPRAAYYLIPSRLQILSCEPVQPITTRIRAEIAYRRSALQTDEPTRLERLYLRHDLQLLEGLVAPEPLTPEAA